MKLEDIPDFAKPYKKRGYDVRKKGNSYQLFRISSKHVEGKSYPVLIQDYIGVIDSDGSLKRKANHVEGDIYLEFGLSDFIYKKHHRTLMRSIFNSGLEQANQVVLLAIVLYCLGCVSDSAIRHSRLTADRAQELIPVREIKIKQITRLKEKIATEQEKLLGEDRAEFEFLMRLCVMDRMSAVPPNYSQPALEILQRRGIAL